MNITLIAQQLGVHYHTARKLVLSGVFGPPEVKPSVRGFPGYEIPNEKFEEFLESRGIEPGMRLYPASIAKLMLNCSSAQFEALIKSKKIEPITLSDKFGSKRFFSETEIMGQMIENTSENMSSKTSLE